MKRSLLRIISALLLAAMLMPLVSCIPKETRFSISWFDYFDTVITLTAYAPDRAAFDAASRKTEECFQRYHRLFDVYNEYEGIINLASVNRMAGEETAVEGEIIKLLALGKEYEKLTNGKLNIAMGAVLALWHDAREQAALDPGHAAIPDKEALISASAHCDINKIVLNSEKNTVTLLDPEMRIDVGAIAKGYAADRAAEILSETGYPFLLNCGGAVLAGGKKPGGESWTAGILDPFSDGFAETVNVSDAALSTSGSYLRSFSVGGRNYGHIIDPDTLMPAEKVASMSVIVPGTTGACLADALSTACFILGTEGAKELLSAVEGAEGIVVENGGRTSHITN
ncbi:MAG: FAD:protein FMN transferase [Clostridiales bacterium]|nr:FAD:protein FMN transferase [Clostridiales bacterium]